MKQSILILLIGLLLVSCTLNMQDTKKNKNSRNNSTPEVIDDSLQFPDVVSYVNDFDNILTESEENRLDQTCSDYDTKTTNQIVIATFKTHAPYSNIENFSTDLYNFWHLGTKEKNNGLLFVVFKEEHKVRMTTGLGTEKILTNEVCDTIVKQFMKRWN